jgi:hypothetical protein
MTQLSMEKKISPTFHLAHDNLIHKSVVRCRPLPNARQYKCARLQENPIKRDINWCRSSRMYRWGGQNA